MTSHSNTSSSESKHSTASTFSSKHRTNDQTVIELVPKDPTKYCEHWGTIAPYVALDPEYLENLCWSNNPDDLYLETYFHPDKPNVANSYNVEGLKPVVRDTNTDFFILQDVEDRFYLWEAWEGLLLRVPDVWTEGFKSNEQIVMNLIIYMSFVERDSVPIYRDRRSD
ncbi:hypothetical protein BDU57DRAFT_523811 [Ampelomyces quisqualis]|uniref:Uncharacterized protein n=1 Tax=Ampelomyces quisqualis TaxID=50730 RepID=A0A6A5Q8X8_AMPQU|nr:hypothetical protein BDU57DRAFT_523811 [Ampelomyces quisqualis]